MIGQPIRKINHVCLADDYNRLVEVIKPYQNLSIGQGLNGVVTSTGISISVAKVPGGGKNEFPFKVEADSLSACTVNFGRVFEERNFKGYEVSTNDNLSFIELSSVTAFNTTSGKTLQLNPQSNKESIVITLPANYNEEVLSSNLKYNVVLSSSITPNLNYAVHIIANLTKASGDTSWTVEQVLMGDYTFARNPSVPFDITRYGDKWVMYVPAYSLVINGEDWSRKISGLNRIGLVPVAAVVGDWYEFDPTKEFLRITPTSTSIYSLGRGFGDVSDVQLLSGPPAMSVMKSWKISNGTQSLMHGAINYEYIRPDSGDSSSKFRSIAQQKTTHGFYDDTTDDYTFELHGFADALAVRSDPNDKNQTSYTYKIPIREQQTGLGPTSELRWMDYNSLSALSTSAVTNITGKITVNGTTSGEVSGLSAVFDFPFRVRTSVDPNATGGVDVLLGRVYEYNCFPDTVTTDSLINFQEWSFYQNTTPGNWWPNNGVPNDDYLAITQGGVLRPDQFDIISESYAISQGWTIVRRLAKITAVGGAVTNIEQIQMGDVALTHVNTVPFTVAKLAYTDIFYLPPNSIVINGVDYTSSCGGLSQAGITNWYSVWGGTAPMNLYIKMKDTGDTYGSVDSVTIGTSHATGSFELITIPIYDYSTRRHYHIGAVNREIIRTDAHANQYTYMMKSIDESVSNTTGDRTFQLRNFKQGTANSSVLDGTGTYNYSFAVRELDAGDNNAEIKYAPWSEMQTAISGTVTTEITNNFTTYLQGDFWTWYDELSATDLSGRGFWEKGAGSNKNYGTTIGDSSKTSVINLDTRTLETSAWNFNTLIGDNVEANNVTTTALSLSTYQLYLHPDGTVRWQ